MTAKKPDLILNLFKFIVRAEKWEDATKILKDTLGLDVKQDQNDREISGVYLVSCWIKEEKLTKEFYKKVASSSDIAIHSDTKSSSLYPKILQETQAVEERLRWLLLHVSDAIEDYAKHVRAKDGEIIDNKNLDPVTSRLSFESLITILEIDLSWSSQGVDVTKINQVINETSDYESLKEKIQSEVTPKLIWDYISELVLEKPVKWSTLKTKLMKIKKFRNDCAHFHTVTDDDLIQVQNLKKQTMQNLTKKKTYTATDMAAFTHLNKQLAKTMMGISEFQIKHIRSITESTVAAQKAMLENYGLLSQLKASQAIARSLIGNSTLNSAINAQASALSSLAKINIPKVDLSQSTLDSILRAQSAFGDLNIPPQADTDNENNNENTATLDSNDSSLDDDDKKGKKK